MCYRELTEFEKVRVRQWILDVLMYTSSMKGIDLGIDLDNIIQTTLKRYIFIKNVHIILRRKNVPLGVAENIVRLTM